MIIKVRNLQQQTFEVDIDPDRTVLQLKQMIFDKMGETYPVQGQTLIYAGVIMKDDQTVTSYAIESKKFIVVLVKRTEAKAESSVAAVPAAATPVEQLAVTSPPNENLEVIIARIMELGFERHQVTQALSLAENNADRAVEFLFANTIGDEPVTESATGQSADDGPLDFLRNQPQFQHMRQILREQPERLNEVLRQISITNPELLGVIRDHQQEFMDMLNEPPAGSDANSLRIEISAEDQMAVERLKALGFPEDLVIQAYIACDRNEDLAANLLLSSEFEE